MRLLVEFGEWLGRRWSSSKRGRGGAWSRDRWRVGVACLFSPVALWTWRRMARGLAKNYWNQELWDVVVAATPRHLVIATHGFEPLVSPLVAAWCREAGVSPPILVASTLFGETKEVRDEGKVAAVERVLPSVDWKQTLVISDSLEDRSILSQGRRAVLARWKEPSWHPVPGYFPLRYLAVGKYRPADYLIPVVLEQDLPIALLLFATGAGNILSLLLLFLSFHAVYEIGNFENDFEGVKREEKREQDDPGKRRYLCYPIWQAGMLAMFLTGIAVCLDPRLGWQHFFSWLGVLLVVRVVFFLYNRKPAHRRPPLHFLLQVLKHFGLLVVYPATVVGVLLAGSQLVQHSAAYFAYRATGNRTPLRRGTFRLLVFSLGAALAGIFGVWTQDTWPLLALAFLWLGHQFLCQRYGKWLSLSGWMQARRVDG